MRVTAESIERALQLCPGEVQFPLDREEFFAGEGPAGFERVEAA